MFEKERVAIDITRMSISIMIGSRTKISFAETIETPKGAYEQDKIVDSDAIASAIEPIIKKKNIKEAYFVVRGQDIITRHVELPAMKEEALRDSAEFELSQVLGDKIEDLYFDYEVVANKEDGRTEIIIVAVEKGKINTYIELADKLKLKIIAIDSYATVTARIIKNIKKSSKNIVKTSAFLDLEADTNSICIMEWENLIMEKYEGFGIMNSSEKPITNLLEYVNYINSIDLNEVDNEYQTNIERVLESIVGQYNSIIQYCLTGRSRKNIDKIYMIGSASKIVGIDNYMRLNLNSNVSEPLSFNHIKFNIKAPKKVSLKDYLYTYGLLLRRE